MNPPQLPVSRAILALLASAALAAPAVAAPDFEAMRDCDPALYKKFSVMKNLAESQPPETVNSKLPKLNEMLNGLTSSTDELLWPLKDSSTLPAACRLDAGKIKDEIYGGLAELRKLIDEKVQPLLPEEDRSPSQALTEKERAVDALMGDRSKTLIAFKAALSGLNGGGDGPESLRPRAEKLDARLKDIQKRVAEGEKAGATSLGGSSIPEAVREKIAKDAAAARARANAPMGGGFDPERRDGTPNAPAGVPSAAPGAGRSDGGAPAEPVKKIPRPRGADLVDRAEIGHGGDPNESSPGTAVGAVKNSAIKPLGGAISPPSAEEASDYAARKDAAKSSILRVKNMKAGTMQERMEKDAAESSMIADRPFQLQPIVSNGAGTIYVNRDGGQQKRFNVAGYKLSSVKPGDLTPEEDAAIEDVLDTYRKDGK